MAKQREPHHNETWLLTEMEKAAQSERRAMLSRLAELDDEYRTRLRRQYGLECQPSVAAARKPRGR